MRALVLAAGEGTRLRPLTLDRPKPMVPVGGRPVLEHLLALLRRHGVREVAVNLHYRPQAIVEHFGDGSRFGLSLTYSHEERLLGSAGAVARLAEQGFFDTSEPFVVLYGDVLTDLDVSALAAWHVEQGALATLALYRVEDPSRCGIVELDNVGRVQRFVEKPAPGTVQGNLANAGLYVLDPRVLRHIPRGVASDFGHDIFPALLAAGLPLYGAAPEAYVLDIGSAERLAQAEADHASGRFRSPARSARGVGSWVMGHGEVVSGQWSVLSPQSCALTPRPRSPRPMTHDPRPAC